MAVSSTLGRARLRALACALALAAQGCATHASQPRSCTNDDVGEVLGDPARLREAADAALQDDEAEQAYRYLALIAELHPDSAEARELFPAAAKLYKRAYFRNRIGSPRSAWLHAEPALMYFWLSRFFESPEAFPQQQVDLLFVGMPYDFYVEFEAYVRARPTLFQRWSFEAKEDGGRIEAVRGLRDGEAPTAAIGGPR